MHTRHVTAAWLLSLILLVVAGCNRNDVGRAPTAKPVAAAAPTAADPAITMRYACQGGANVEVMGSSGRARASLPDGSVIGLSKIAGSMPPVFAGGSLYFAIGSTAAHLSQQDGTNELACTPQ